MSPKSIAVIGAGARGRAYAEYATRYPERARVVAVAEPITERRDAFAAQHQIDPTHCYTDDTALLMQPKLADGLLICTTDMHHTVPALAALDRGYDVLLEKPMAPTPAECRQLVEATQTTGHLLQICHVLRFTAFFQTVRRLVQSGVLGRVTHVTHSENLAYWHMAHSFVRGNWRNTEVAGPMILAKCCHDFDILTWILGVPVRYVSSFGALTHFRPENAPEGATDHCLDDCPAADYCDYYAPAIYATDAHGWPYDVVTPQASVEARLAALQTGPYGRCVYKCDNNVVDHQTVNMVLEDKTTTSLVMNGHGDREARTMRYDGTSATLYGRFESDEHELRLHHHRSGEVEYITIKDAYDSQHGGGDLGIMQHFIDALNGQHSPNLTTAAVSLESHLLAFAAEQSRLNHCTIDMRDFRRT